MVAVISWLITIALVGYVVFQTVSIVKKLLLKRREKRAALENKEKEGTENDSGERMDGTHGRTD